MILKILSNNNSSLTKYKLTSKNEFNSYYSQLTVKMNEKMQTSGFFLFNNVCLNIRRNTKLSF